jgi:hypothetical protein
MRAHWFTMASPGRLSPELFEQMPNKRIGILTYHKFPQDDWRMEEFATHSVELAGGENRDHEAGRARASWSAARSLAGLVCPQPDEVDLLAKNGSRAARADWGVDQGAAPQFLQQYLGGKRATLGRVCPRPI